LFIVALDVDGHVSPSFASWQHHVLLVAAMISAEYGFAVNVETSYNDAEQG
jgi:hypothetical protein